MRKLFISTSILLIAFGLLGCNFVYSIVATPTPGEELLSTPDALPTQAAGNLPPLTGDWHIRLAQTGGIAGISRTMEISSDGKMTITDERTQKESSRQLSDDEMSKLTELVASTSYLPNKQPMGCADCFIFDLQISNGGKDFHVQIDQVNLPGTGLEPLIGFLGQLLNSKL